MARRGQPNGPGYVQQRPDRDTVPLIDCGVIWCGRQALGLTMVAVTIDQVARGFCSAGCASRWLIRYEIRDRTPTAMVIEGPPTPGQVRAWASSLGIPVGAKGRVPAELVRQYAEAHP